MNQSKTYFQQLSSTLEQYLKEYKNSYPIDYGAVFRNFLPKLLIIAAPILFFFVIVNPSRGMIVTSIFVAPALLIFGIILLVKQKNEGKAPVDTLQKINALKPQLEQFTQYPDVKNYLLRYDQEIEHTKLQKSQILKRFTTGVTVFFAILIMVIFIALVGIVL